MPDSQMILEVKGLKKYFPLHKGVFKRVIGHVKAVDDVAFSIKTGETVGLVGESGCGKSTTGRTIIGLHRPTAGSIRFRRQGEMRDITKPDGAELKALRRDMQMIFQDPYSSLDPRMPIADIISEPLRAHKIGSKVERKERVGWLLEKVGLNSTHMSRYPNEFSGGQRQRIGIARALALNPSLVICDEPVSALDVSVQAQILNLLKELQGEMNLTYLFIAHDLSVVEHVSDRIMVMYLGRVVESGTTEDIYATPKHPYTEALLAAIPAGDPLREKKRLLLEGVVPDPVNPPPGCTFHTRCPYVQDICRQEIPPTLGVGGEHVVACHRARELDLRGYL